MSFSKNTNITVTLAFSPRIAICENFPAVKRNPPTPRPAPEDTVSAASSPMTSSWLIKTKMTVHVNKHDTGMRFIPPFRKTADSKISSIKSGKYGASACGTLAVSMITFSYNHASIIKRVALLIKTADKVKQLPIQNSIEYHPIEMEKASQIKETFYKINFR